MKRNIGNSEGERQRGGKREVLLKQKELSEELLLQELSEVERVAPALTELWRSFHNQAIRDEKSLDCCA